MNYLFHKLEMNKRLTAIEQKLTDIDIAIEKQTRRPKAVRLKLWL